MTEQFTQVKVVHHVERMKNSKNGNARYEFTFADSVGEFHHVWKLEKMRTEPDAMWVCGISPDLFVGRPVAVTFHYTGHGTRRGVVDALATCAPWHEPNAIKALKRLRAEGREKP